MKYSNAPITILLSRQIAVSTEKVWEIISQPSHLSYCHPFCQKNPVEKWPGVGSKDTIYFYSGEVATRDFKKWIPGIGYDLELTLQNTGIQVHVEFRISSFFKSPEKSLLQILLELINISSTSESFHSRYSYSLIRYSLNNYLDSVLKGYEHYITTKQATKRNQFGSHPIFSPTID